jgi:hypothetical protein
LGGGRTWCRRVPSRFASNEYQGLLARVLLSSSSVRLGLLRPSLFVAEVPGIYSDGGDLIGSD